MSVNDEGIGYKGQVRGVDDNGSLKILRMNNNGAVKVEVVNEGEEITTKTESTYLCNIYNAAATINIGKEVSTIDVANYSEENTITIVIDSTTNYTIGPCIAKDIVINKEVSTIGIEGTTGDIKVQLDVRTVE